MGVGKRFISVFLAYTKPQVWPCRNDFGSLQLRRRYGFEFTSTGEQRYQGLIELSGQRLQRIELEAQQEPQCSLDGSRWTSGLAP